MPTSTDQLGTKPAVDFPTTLESNAEFEKVSISTTRKQGWCSISFTSLIMSKIFLHHLYAERLYARGFLDGTKWQGEGCRIHVRSWNSRRDEARL